MRTPIFPYFLLFLACVLITAPASYGQGDATAPPTLTPPVQGPFYPLTSWQRGGKPVLPEEISIFSGQAQNAAGTSINGRVITAYSSGSVAGKWQYLSTPTAVDNDALIWKNLPAVGVGEGFLLTNQLLYSLRFVSLSAETIDATFAEEIINADTPPTLSFRAWDAIQSTQAGGTVTPLADLGTAISIEADELTITLYGLDDLSGDARAATLKEIGQRDKKIKALEAAKSAVEAAGLKRDTEINALEAAKSVAEAAAAQRDLEISALQAAATQRDIEISALQAALSIRNAVLHVVAPSSADEGVRAYPNPTSRLLQVAGLAPAQTYIYRLHTAAGKHVSQGTLLTNEPIDISALGKGQYLLTIQDETGKQLFTTPLVVQ